MSSVSAPQSAPRLRRSLLGLALAGLLVASGGGAAWAQASPDPRPAVATAPSDGHDLPDPPPGWTPGPRGKADTVPGALPCESDGRRGKRIQVVYAHRGAGDALTAAKVATIRANVLAANGFLQDSARQVGARRNFRFVTKGCQLDIVDLQTPVATTEQLLSVAQGSVRFRSPDRVYLVFVSTQFVHPAGVAGQSLSYEDDRPSPLVNRNSSSANMARIYNWNEITVAHEIGHALGATLTNAPGATSRGHCWDGGYAYDTGADLMCYDDGSLPRPLVDLCAGDAGRPAHYYDCRKDTYFNPNPPRGSYLATHWNIANSLFMTAADVDPARAYPKVDDAFSAILGRRADDAGRLYWASKLLEGFGPDRIIVALANTNESRRRNGLPNHQADPAKWVQAIYRNALCRQPDAAGLAYWTGFAKRRGIEYVAATLAGSAEGRRRQAAAPGAGAVICPAAPTP